MNDGDERLRADSGDVPLFIVIHRQTVSLPQRTDEHLIHLGQILTTAPGLKNNTETGSQRGPLHVDNR